MASLCQKISSFSSNPLFSAIVALYTLILLYFPSPFRRLIFSPLLFSTSVLLFSVLRLRASQRTARFASDRLAVDPAVQDIAFNALPQPAPRDSRNDRVRVGSCFVPDPVREPSSLPAPRDSRNDGAGPRRGPDPNPIYEDSFVEWNVRAPLEVIREEHEEGEQDDDVSMRKRAADMGGIERYASLSLCYPETDSDSCSSDGEFPGDGEWGSPGNECFRWEGMDRDELIEIKLDGKRGGNEVLEEDNLIEIDLSPATINGGLCDDEVLD